MAEAPEHIEKRNHIVSAIGSLSIHTAIILLMLYLTLSTPIPPYPEGGGGEGSGLEINLGTSETGLGITQSEEIDIPEEEPSRPKQETSAAPEKILTQDYDDEEDAIKDAPKKDVKKVKPAVTPTPVETTKPIKKAEEEKPVVKKPVVNPNALYKPRPNNQGITQGSGDQGKPTGNPSAPTYTGQGKGGEGGEGAGGGTGGGIGTGSGKGKGPGTSFDLKGRTYLSLPKPDYHSQVEGDVVVEIVVDKEGKVTTATPGVKGSTTLDETLLKLAKQAALNARFDRKPDAAAFQQGTITYRFRLQ